MSVDEFRAAMARLPAGVVVVSTSLGGGFRGLTASTFIAVSLDPPLVLVSLDRVAATRVAIEAAAAFNISVLARSQEFLAERFAGRAPAVDPSWREVPHRLGRNGIPLVEGAIAWCECRLEALHPAGDHDIAIGAVESAASAPGDPLILWERTFWGPA